MKKAIIAPVGRLGFRIVHCSWSPTDEEATELTLRALPYGGNWAGFIGAECLKKLNLTDTEVALSLTLVSRQEDDFTRQGTLHARVVVMPSSDYVELVKTGPLGIRHVFRKEFRGLEGFLPPDLPQVLEHLSDRGPTTAEGQDFKPRELARIAFDLRRYQRAVITHAYEDSSRWLAVEHVILDVLQALPTHEMAQVSFATFALSMREPSDIVAIPLQMITGSSPPYLSPVGTHDVPRSPADMTRRFAADIVFIIGRLVGNVRFWLSCRLTRMRW